MKGVMATTFVSQRLLRLLLLSVLHTAETATESQMLAGTALIFENKAMKDLIFETHLRFLHLEKAAARERDGGRRKLRSIGTIRKLMGGRLADEEPVGNKLCAVTAPLARGTRWAGAFSSTQEPRRKWSVEAEQVCRSCSTSGPSRKERSDGAWTPCLRSGRAGHNARH